MILQIFDVLGVMKSNQLLPSCQSRPIDIKLSIEVKTLDEAVRHRNSLRLHWVVFAVVEFAHFLVVEVGNSLLATHIYYKVHERICKIEVE